MDQTVITISVPKETTQEEIMNIRSTYKDRYKINIIISGNNNPEDIIKSFLQARLEV